MPLQIVCPHCEKDYTVADTMLGKQVRCKNCSEPFTAEEAAIEEAVVAEADVGREGAPRKRSLGGSDRHKRPVEADEAPRRKARGKDEEEDEEEPDHRPRKKAKRGTPVWVWLLVVGIALVGVGGTVLVLVLLLGGNSKLTAENIAKVKAGMTEQQVIDLIGAPNRTIDAADAAKQLPKEFQGLGAMLGNMKTMEWSNNKDIQFACVFQNGNLVFSGGLVPGGGGGPQIALGPNLPNIPMPNPLGGGNPFGGNPFGNLPMPNPIPNRPPVEDKMTQANVNKLRKGMPEPEVINLLGNPTATHDFDGKKNLIYMSPLAGVNVTVGMVNGKADSLTGINGDQVGSFPAFDPQGNNPKPMPPNPNPMPMPPFPNPMPPFPNPMPPNPNPNQNPMGNMAGTADPAKLQPNMSEQQVINLFGQPLQMVNLTPQAALGKGIPQQVIQKGRNTFHTVTAFVYNKANGQPGQIEILFVSGRLYRFNQ